jgi:hypothetical protein
MNIFPHVYLGNGIEVSAQSFVLVGLESKISEIGKKGKGMFVCIYVHICMFMSV